MGKKVIVILIIILGFHGYGQVNFEKGYFVTMGGEKTECLIKNIDWKDNPKEFIYKQALGGEEQTESISRVKEFVINGISKYIKATVKMDRSSESIEKLTEDKNPNFKEETVFLKQLVEGKASLYRYEDGNLRRFFYQVNEGEIQPLVYKKYKSEQRYQNRTILAVAKNNHYKQQIWSDLKCGDLSLKDAENAEYRTNSLIKYFVKYNSCVDPNFVLKRNTTQKDAFHITIRPGVNFSSLSVDNSRNNLRDIDFGGNTSFRIGAEIEYVLPFNNNKWSVFLEPTFQSYKAEKFITYFQSTLLTIETNVTADYTSIEFPLGVRHYFFLNDSSKLFVDGGLVIFDASIDSIIDFEDDRGMDLEIDGGETGSNFFAGFGYNYQSKYSVEARYGFGRELLGPFSGLSSSYNTFSLVFGYTIF